MIALQAAIAVLLFHVLDELAIIHVKVGTMQLPRFMSRAEWDALSDEELAPIDNAADWVRFHPGKTREDWGMVNRSHPENKGVDLINLLNEYRRIYASRN